jgi:hypothetical protein
MCGYSYYCAGTHTCSKAKLDLKYFYCYCVSVPLFQGGRPGDVGSEEAN